MSAFSTFANDAEESRIGRRVNVVHLERSMDDFVYVLIYDDKISDTIAVDIDASKSSLLKGFPIKGVKSRVSAGRTILSLSLSRKGFKKTSKEIVEFFQSIGF
jgi:hypothetical protein